MNGITRFISFLVSGALAVFLLIFFTTVGLALALVVAVALFVGGLALRGKGRTFKNSSFRVVTYNLGDIRGNDEGNAGEDISSYSGQFQNGSPNNSETPRLDRQTFEHTKASEDCIDLSPDDYREIPSSDNKNSPK